MRDQSSKSFLSGEVSTRYVLALALGVGGWSHTADNLLADRMATLETSARHTAQQLVALQARHDRESDQTAANLRRELDAASSRMHAIESRQEMSR